MHVRPFLAALLLPVLLAASPSARGSAVLYAIADGGASLIRFNSANPSAVTVVGSFGGATTFLDGIDFRPSTGELYGYLDSTDSFYRIDLNTAGLTLVSTSSTPTNTFNLGIDFNPQVVAGGVLTDRLRIVTESQQNLRANIETGATVNDGTLTYAVGDVNENSPATRIIDAAYTNNDTNINTPTSLYYIDQGLDILATTSAPNSGILNTVGSLGVDTNSLVGFDILTAGGVNSAYALLTVGGTPGLYSIDLGTGGATLLGELPTDLGNIYGLAATAAAVPEPSTLALGGIAALGGLVAARRRRG